MRRLAFALLGLTALLGGGLWFWSQGRTPSTSGIDPEVQQHGPTSSPTDASAQRTDLPDQDPPVEVRVPIQHNLSGLVVDENGQSIVDATVTWTALQSQDLEWEPAWQHDDWGELDRLSLVARTKNDGRFAFTTSLEFDPLIGSVVWASRSGYLSACELIISETVPEDKPRRLVLKRAKQMLVRVEDANGEPVAGATVEHFGTTPATGIREKPGELDPQRVRRVLFEKCVTDAQGEANLAAFPGEQVIRATTPTSCSIPWRGPATKEVVLRVMDQFTIGGLVSLPDWSHLDYVGERRLTITARRGSVSRSLVSLRSVQAGPWGPVTLPIVRGARYTVRLAGSPIIPVNEDFPAPFPSDHVVIDLAADMGHDVWLVAMNEAEELIPNAEAQIGWIDDKGRENTLSRRAGVDPEHYIHAWSVPTGSISVRLHAPGYASKSEGPFEIPMEEPVVLAVVLEPAGHLTGTCLHAGKPVQDFQVLTWRTTASSRTTQLHTFLDRKDGRFEIETLPMEDVFVVASSADLPPGKPVLAQMTDGSADVTLHLESPLRGTGRVVDSETGDPISNARFEYVVAREPSGRKTWGVRTSVSPDGGFELIGLSHGENRVRFEAPGYGETDVEFAAQPGETTDLGRVALERLQSFELRLRAPGGAVDFAQFTLETVDARGLGLQRFSPEGVARVDGMSPGSYRFMIKHEYEDWTIVDLELVPGRDWIFEHRVSGPGSLSIEVIEGGDVTLEEVVTIYVSYVDSNGVKTLHAISLDDEGKTVLEGIDADRVTAVAAGAAAREFASATGDFAGDDALHITLPLGGALLHVKVTDDDGNPVPGALVTLTNESGEIALNHGVRTDDLGVAELISVPEYAVRVHLHHPELGTRLNIPWQGGAGELELELRSDADIRLRLVDGATPIAGARTAIVDGSGSELTAARMSTETGAVELSRLTPGVFRVQATHPDCWPVAIDATAAVDAPVVSIQMRSLGALELEVRDDRGLPVVGVNVALRSIEFQETVQGWLDGRLIQGTGLTTDTSGSLSLRGLPHGDYQWSIERSSSSDATGVLTVEPRTTMRVVLRLPAE